MALDGWKIYDVLKDAGAWGGLLWLFKSAVGIFRNRLTKEQKQLLVLARTADGFVHYCNYSGIGPPYVQTGAHPLGDSELSRAEFVEALARLVNRGYLLQVEENCYTLTATGIKAADLFKPSVQIESIPIDDGRAKPGPGAQVG